MEFKEYISLLNKRKSTVFSITILFILVVLIVSIIQPLKYSATSKLLVVQKTAQITDSYSMTRSNQYLSSLLSQVIYSDSFYNDVINAGFNFDKEIFSSDVNKRKKEWAKTVDARSMSDTGMITIYTYHQDKYIADQLNQAVAYVLRTQNAKYHGLGDNIDVKIIDNTSVSDWPVKPNVPLNLALAIFIGVVVGCYYIYLFPDKEFKFDIMPKKKKKINHQHINHQSVHYEPVKSEPVTRNNDYYDHTPKREESIDFQEPKENFERRFRGDIGNIFDN